MGKKSQSSAGMMSINHGVFVGLCIKTQTKERAKNSKRGVRNVTVIGSNTMTEHSLRQFVLRDEAPSVFPLIV